MSGTDFTKSYQAYFNDTPESAVACEQVVRDIVAATDGVSLHSLETRRSEEGEGPHDVTVDFEVQLEPRTNTGRTIHGTLSRHARDQTMCDGIAEQGPTSPPSESAAHE